MAEKNYRNLYFPDSLWVQVKRAAALASGEQGRAVSPSEWVRTACEKELRRQEKRLGA
jgi:hypothetical protein